MQSRKNHHSNYFSGTLFLDLMNPPTGRRSRKQSEALVEYYQSRGDKLNQNNNQDIGLIGNLIKASSQNLANQFQKQFVFGANLTIWRKKKFKPCIFFIDQNLPSFLWISTKTKAFLFDLTYTTIQRYNFQLQRATKLTHYLILYYFQEEIPIVFQGPNAAEQVEKYYELFSNYISHNRIMLVYPSYISKIMKGYIIQQIKDDAIIQRKVIDVLKVSADVCLNNEQYNLSIIKQIFTKKGASFDPKTAYLTSDEMTDFFKISNCVKLTKQIFQRYSGIKLKGFLQYLQPLMRKQSFKLFLEAQQQQTHQFIDQIYNETQQLISFYDFSTYLLNQKNNYAAQAIQVNQQLPLTDYFCFSSHNTYLSGNQLTSDSKIQRYLEDLDNGLKCVQIDVHNEGSRPIITHAFNDKSFCKPIDFQQTIKVIAQFCQKHPNHYPIVLSIQNHAKQQNRYKMFNILNSHFQKRLFKINSDAQFNNFVTCKTLSELKGKIIIKTDSKINQIKSFITNKISPQPQTQTLNLFKPSESFIPNSFPSKQCNERFARFQQLSKIFKTRKDNFINQIHRDLYLPLAQMTKITGMFKAPSGIDTENSSGYQCTSLTNQKAAKTNDQKIIYYTKRSWLRIYPLGTEIGSSNYNPIPHLKQGAQIIALNTQTRDDYAWLLKSYFTCGRELVPSKIGYIPKPLHLISNYLGKQDRILKMIQIQNLSTQKINIRFFGSDRDMKTNANSTFSYNVVDYFQAFLMFEIGTKFKDCIPIRFIRKGYRVLIAKNQFFRDSGMRILIRINIKELTSF